MNAKDLIISEYSSYIVFITGGTKSGKSEFAEHIAKEVKNLFKLLISFAYVVEGIRIKIKPVKIRENIYLLMFRFILKGFG